jgi:hypothetical protein
LLRIQTKLDKEGSFLLFSFLVKPKLLSISNMNGHSSDKQPLRVALIGGGLGGLAFAQALLRTKSNVDLTIYEGARVFSEIGAGIGMGQNAFDVMCYLGLEEVSCCTAAREFLFNGY